MLYQFGAVQMDTYPFSADEVSRNAGADFAVKPVIGSLPNREFMGEGDDELSISGQLLPSKIGGLTELETLHALRRAGEQLPVMRGDGVMLGWFAITRIQEEHKDLERNGVGFTVQHTIDLVRIGPEGASRNIIGTLRSLFGAFGI